MRRFHHLAETQFHKQIPLNHTDDTSYTFKLEQGTAEKKKKTPDNIHT